MAMMRRFGRKQPDGSWKFVIDGAGAKIASEPARKKAEPSRNCRYRKPGARWDRPRRWTKSGNWKGMVGQAATRDARRALGSCLASDAWVMGSSAEPDAPRTAGAQKS